MAKLADRKLLEFKQPNMILRAFCGRSLMFDMVL